MCSMIFRPSMRRWRRSLLPWDPGAWRHDSSAAGWTVDVVLHLAQTEEFVLASVTGHAAPLLARDRDGPPLDELMDRLVAAQRTAPPVAGVPPWRCAPPPAPAPPPARPPTGT